MSDYIKREDATAVIRKTLGSLGNSVVTEINSLSGFVADRPTGKWIDYIGEDLGIEGQWLRDDGKTVFVQCDKCDSIFVRNLMIHMNYCPNCGSKMEGGEDE